MFVNGLFTRERIWIYLKYDADENRIFRDSDQTGRRKYIVDIVADLPVLLTRLNNRGGIVKTYIYVYSTRRANSRIIARHFDFVILYVIDL